MKKIKMIFLAIAGIVGIGGAFSFTSKQTNDHFQFIKGVFTDLEAGGHTWTCTGTSPTCTYHSDGSRYTVGVFDLIN